MAQPTYEWLFAFLEQLGFEDSSPSEFERVFEHSDFGMLLAFSMLDDSSVDRPVRDADITSVETRLHQEGLLERALTTEFQRSTKR